MWKPRPTPGPGDYELFPRTDHPLDPRNDPEEVESFVDEREAYEQYQASLMEWMEWEGSK